MHVFHSCARFIFGQRSSPFFRWPNRVDASGRGCRCYFPRLPDPAGIPKSADSSKRPVRLSDFFSKRGHPHNTLDKSNQTKEHLIIFFTPRDQNTHSFSRFGPLSTTVTCSACKGRTSNIKEFSSHIAPTIEYPITSRILSSIDS